MRLVVQRVKNAKVGASEIGKGLLVLVGIKKEDKEKQAINLAEKLSKLRVMADRQQKMNLTVSDVNASILVVSQFTLHGDTAGGNRPSFMKAEEPERARRLYNLFTKSLKEKGINVKTGTFGNYMEIEAVLDGPVTILYLD